MTKNDLQNQVLELSRNCDNLIIEHCTGLGKTLSAIKIIESTNTDWNIVIAEITHEQNWIDEFYKHNKSHLLLRVKFFCYQSLHKYIENKDFIFDEVHHLVNTDLRIELLKKLERIRYQTKFIFLSATLTWKQKDIIRDVCGPFSISKFNISQAVKEGLLPRPSIYLIPIKLDNSLKTEEYIFNKNLKIKCTQQDKYNRLTQRISYLKDQFMSNQTESNKIRWLSAGNTRKKYLAECKTVYAKTLLEHLKNKRLICFTNSIQQSNELDKKHSINSKLSKQKIEELISDFNTGKIDKLFCVGMLKEGINLNNIECGIIIQLDNVERSLTQEHGRILRAEYPELYILYIMDTQDDVYIETTLSSMNQDYITTATIEELIN